MYRILYRSVPETGHLSCQGNTQNLLAKSTNTHTLSGRKKHMNEPTILYFIDGTSNITYFLRFIEFEKNTINSTPTTYFENFLLALPIQYLLVVFISFKLI